MNIEKYFESLDRKIDKLTESLIEIKIEQIEIKLDLKEHIRRTEIAEERLEQIESRVTPLLEKVKFTKWIFSGVCFVSSLVMAYLKYHG